MAFVIHVSISLKDRCAIFCINLQFKYMYVVAILLYKYVIHLYKRNPIKCCNDKSNQVTSDQCGKSISISIVFIYMTRLL